MNKKAWYWFKLCGVLLIGPQVPFCTVTTATAQYYEPDIEEWHQDTEDDNTTENIEREQEQFRRQIEQQRIQNHFELEDLRREQKEQSEQLARDREEMRRSMEQLKREQQDQEREIERQRFQLRQKEWNDYYKNR